MMRWCLILVFRLSVSFCLETQNNLSQNDPLLHDRLADSVRDAIAEASDPLVGTVGSDKNRSIRWWARLRGPLQNVFRSLEAVASTADSPVLASTAMAAASVKREEMGRRSFPAAAGTSSSTTSSTTAAGRRNNNNKHRKKKLRYDFDDDFDDDFDEALAGARLVSGSLRVISHTAGILADGVRVSGDTAAGVLGSSVRVMGTGVKAFGMGFRGVSRLLDVRKSDEDDHPDNNINNNNNEGGEEEAAFNHRHSSSSSVYSSRQKKLQSLRIMKLYAKDEEGETQQHQYMGFVRSTRHVAAKSVRLVGTVIGGVGDSLLITGAAAESLASSMAGVAEDTVRIVEHVAGSISIAASFQQRSDNKKNKNKNKTSQRYRSANNNDNNNDSNNNDQDNSTEREQSSGNNRSPRSYVSFGLDQHHYHRSNEDQPGVMYLLLEGFHNVVVQLFAEFYEFLAAETQGVPSIAGEALFVFILAYVASIFLLSQQSSSPPPSTTTTTTTTTITATTTAQQQEQQEACSRASTSKAKTEKKLSSASTSIIERNNASWKESEKLFLSPSNCISKREAFLRKLRCFLLLPYFSFRSMLQQPQPGDTSHIQNDGGDDDNSNTNRKEAPKPGSSPEEIMERSWKKSEKIFLSLSSTNKNKARTAAAATAAIIPFLQTLRLLVRRTCKVVLNVIFHRNFLLLVFYAIAFVYLCRASQLRVLSVQRLSEAEGFRKALSHVKGSSTLVESVMWLNGILETIWRVDHRHPRSGPFLNQLGSNNNNVEYPIFVTRSYSSHDLSSEDEKKSGRCCDDDDDDNNNNNNNREAGGRFLPYGGLEPYLASVIGKSIIYSLESSKAVVPQDVAYASLYSLTLGDRPPTIRSIAIGDTKDNKSNNNNYDDDTTKKSLLFDVDVDIVLDSMSLILDVKLSSLDYALLPSTKVAIQALDSRAQLKAKLRFQPDYPFLSTVELSLAQTPECNIRITPLSRDSGLRGVDLGSVPVLRDWINFAIREALAGFVSPRYVAIDVNGLLKSYGETITDTPPPPPPIVAPKRTNHKKRLRKKTSIPLVPNPRTSTPEGVAIVSVADRLPSHHSSTSVVGSGGGGGEEQHQDAKKRNAKKKKDALVTPVTELSRLGMDRWLAKNNHQEPSIIDPETGKAEEEELSPSSSRKNAKKMVLGGRLANIVVPGKNVLSNVFRRT